MAIINPTNNFFWAAPNFVQQIDKIQSLIMVIKNWQPKIFNHQLWQSKVDNQFFFYCLIQWRENWKFSHYSYGDYLFSNTTHNVVNPNVMKFFHALILMDAIDTLRWMPMWHSTQNGHVMSIFTTLAFDFAFLRFW